MQRRTGTTGGRLFLCGLFFPYSSSPSTDAAAFFIPQTSRYSSILQQPRYHNTHQRNIHRWRQEPVSLDSPSTVRAKACTNSPTKLWGSNDADEDLDFQRYNDDAFGLIFLIGGFATQDFDFACTFLVTSAAAAIATSRNILPSDPRVPGAVAIVSLLLSPVISSLRSGGGGVGAPLPIEVGLCCFSLIVGIYKWKKSTQI